MSYTKTTWVNNQAPAINADNLNHMEQGIESAHNQIDINTSDIDSLETQVQTNTQNIASETSARQSTDTSLQTQIDQLIAPSGEAPSAAEIENARIGAPPESTVYPTLGDAIRGQVTDLKSALNDIKPMWINPTKTYYPVDDIDGISSASGYYVQANSGYAPSYQSSLQHLVVPINAGDVLQCYTGNNDITSNSVAFSFFCTVDDDDICHSFVTWEKIDDANKIYQLIIPKNVTKLYLTYSTGVTPWVKKCENEYSLDWLKLKSGNFDNSIIPIDAINKNSEYKYSDSLLKPFAFSGKTATAFGDSISYGVCSPNLGQTTPFIARFFTSVGLLYGNASRSGACIADPNDANSILNKVLNFTTTKDFYFVAGGTNDFNTSKELGTFASTSTSTFYGALKAICEKFKTDFPNAVVFFITPIPYTEAFFDLHPELKNGNALGYTLNDYRNAIYEVATSYKFNVVDGSRLGMPISKGGWSNDMCDDTDGCHPTIAGHELYARNLQGKLL